MHSKSICPVANRSTGFHWRSTQALTEFSSQELSYHVTRPIFYNKAIDYNLPNPRPRNRDLHDIRNGVFSSSMPKRQNGESHSKENSYSSCEKRSFNKYDKFFHRIRHTKEIKHSMNISHVQNGLIVLPKPSVVINRFRQTRKMRPSTTEIGIEGRQMKQVLVVHPNNFQKYRHENSDQLIRKGNFSRSLHRKANKRALVNKLEEEQIELSGWV